MAIDPERLRLGAYPFVSQLEPRYGDQDPNGHVNNVAIARYYEEARVRLLMELSRRAGRDSLLAVVIVELTIRYTGEVRYPSVLSIGSAVVGVGRTSCRMAQALFDGDQVLGTADSALVLWTEGRPTPIDAALGDALRGCAFNPETPR